MILKRTFTILAVIWYIFLTITILNANDTRATVTLDKKYYNILKRNRPINRDKYLDVLKNKIIQCKGTITTVSKVKRYRKKYKITILDSNSKLGRFEIIYHVYFNDRNIFIRLKPGLQYEFSGQLLLVTPLNSSRSKYIFDIILKTGAILID